VGLSTTSLDFGDSSTSQTVTITNTGGTALPYTLTTDASTAVLQLNRSGGTLQPGTSHTLVVTLDRSAAPEGDFTANIRVNAGSAGQPLVGVRASIAPRAPEVSEITLTPDGWFFPACETQASVTFSDENGVTGRLFWDASAPTGTGNRALTRDGGRLVAELPVPLTIGQTIEVWVVLTDALGASTESAHRTLTATNGSC
jgi:hypothetical protein